MTIHPHLPSGRFTPPPRPFDFDCDVFLARQHRIPIITLEESSTTVLNQALERDADARIRESHHRIKNNLQLVASMLSMQARDSDPLVAAELKVAMGRVMAIARLHERLQSCGDQPVSMRPFLEALCADLAAGTGCEARGVRLELSADSLELTPDEASNLGLIVNELVTNSLKYAYRDCEGVVEVVLDQVGEGRRLSVSDHGPGLPPEAASAAHGFGLALVKRLARKLGGSVSLESPARGARICVRF